MKKHLNLFPYLLFLFGAFMLTNCERDEEFLPEPEEATAKAETELMMTECYQESITSLQHVLLFEFNDNTEYEVKKGFTKALYAFKDSIEEVKELEWGKNFNWDSNDDFSLCFILTFYSMDDFLVYLNHPVHINFINTWLNPNIQDVIAFDYWAENIKSDKQKHHHYKHHKDKEMRHLVLYNYNDDILPEDKDNVVESFTALPRKIHTINTFEWGSEILLLGLHQDFDDAFSLTFNSVKTYMSYLHHPVVKYFYYKIAEPNTQDILVIDYYIN